MKIRVYFFKETDPEIILRGNKISSQALNTIYDLVWENEFKNILNAVRIWIKFMEEEQPFGTPLRKKKNHYKISLGDIIQISNDFYMVDKVGVKKIKVIE